MSALPAADSPLAYRTAAPTNAYPNVGAQMEGERRTLGRTASSSSTKVDPATIGAPARSGTLKKNLSVRKRGSLSHKLSRRSLRAGSMPGMGNDEDDEGFHNIFHTPIPTQGNPTEVLANRFQAWRKLLKDLITYFREIQTSYEHRSKALLKVSNVINNTQGPTLFMSQGGLNEAITTLRAFHKISLTEADKSKNIEDDVITQLNGLRSDLSQKIKEIKSLAGDFKNSVEKERDGTKKAVDNLKDALAAAESDPGAASGKSDPFIVRLGVDRQVEKQIEEENYLHRAYLNLEGSGRELESIVVGEIQKAYNAYAGILRRETEHAHETIDDLRSGPIAMPKDQEWTHFVENDEHFINPNIPLRRIEDIYYPGKNNPAASEIRGGMLERKSKYLKSYTPGWYVLSPTHLHEFKSADHIHTQQPVMSLYLVDQKLGSRSQPGASSHKFSLKGRQTGGMHRGHSWVFRAESYETMMAWYDDITILTEKSGPEKSAFVRNHARSISAGSRRATSIASSDGLGDDEADKQPYRAAVPLKQDTLAAPKRPSPGGRFPSEIDMTRGLTAPLSPSDRSSSEYRDDTVNSAGSPTIRQPFRNYQADSASQQHYVNPAAATLVAPIIAASALEPAPATRQSQAAAGVSQMDTSRAVPLTQPQIAQTGNPQGLSANTLQQQPVHSSSHDGTQDFAPVIAVADGAVGGAGAYALYQNHNKEKQAAEERHAEIADSEPSNNNQHGIVDGPYEGSVQTSYAEPAGIYPDPVNDYTSRTHPEARSPLREQPPKAEPTLPDLSSAPFDSAVDQTASEPTNGDRGDMATRDMMGESMLKRHTTLGQEQSAAQSMPPPTHLASISFPASQQDTSVLSQTNAIDNTASVDTVHTESDTMLEDGPSRGLHKTGHMFPSVLRHDTSTSISQLHVPGEFPPTTPME